MRAGNEVTVVKLGGSQAFSAHLDAWLEALAACAGRIVLVPGGGPFADAVRSAQPRMGFDDRAAHHMALLAMEQYGCALASRDRTFTLVTSASEIRRALGRRAVPIWSPTRMVLAAPGIPCSWKVTSDSLAAWLAGQLGAKRVLLVKHVGPSNGPLRMDELVTRGVIDPAFPGFLEASGAEAAVADATGHIEAAGALRNGGKAGVRID